MLELAHDHALRLERHIAELEVRRRQAELELELRRRDAEARETENALDAHQRRLAEIEQLLALARSFGLPAPHADPGTAP